MRIKQYLIFIIITLASVTNGQVERKFSPSNAKRIQIQTNPEDLVSVFVKGDLETIVQLTNDLGGIFKYSSGDIASIKIPQKYIAKLSQNHAIKQMELINSHYQVMTDKMILADHTNVISVENGSCPTYGHLFGTDIIMGIIDAGIDFNNADFKNPDSTTRVKFLWDQTLNDHVNAPQPYNYGREWTAASINAGLCTSNGDEYSHGTVDAGIAAGNGHYDGLHHGVAPMADLVVVRIDQAINSEATIADATKWIFDKATLLGEACSINVSLGDYIGSHDGKDLVAQMIDNLVTAGVGRSFSCAAGNAGGGYIHLGYSTNSDTSFTWLNDPTMYFEMWADSLQFNTIKFSIGVDTANISTNYYAYEGNIPFRGLNYYTVLNTGYSDVLTDGLGNTLANILSMKVQQGSTYGIQMQINPVNSSNTTHLFRLMTTGAGHFDCYSYDWQPNNTLPSSVIYPPINYYKMPDTNQSICSSFQCSDKVITVGGYINRTCYVDYCYDSTTGLHAQNCLDTAQYPEGAIYNVSSYGPTRDGRIKPDVTSPGLWVLAPGTLADMAADRTGLCARAAASGWALIASGTSMAAPSVAGIAGLYLQANPFKTSEEVKNCIVENARLDPWVWGPIPNNRWGHGKVDACLTLLCATNGISEVHPSNSYLSNYPNPFNDETTISFNLPDHQTGSITINDILGNVIKTIPLNASQGSITFNKSDLGSGIYFFSLKAEGRTLATKKMIIL